MTSSTRRALRVALAVASACAVAPAAAVASTYTVDDDGAQCPDAPFSSIQAAVDQAAPHDTIVVCPGLYRERSTPPDSSPSNPAQAGSQNGLTIDKPLTIRGAGAAKVVIEPSQAVGDTLAGTAPYLRDGGGNVISITRQSLGATDADENRVDISGVTVRSPNAYAEAGIAFFNTSGSVTASTVGPLRRAVATGTPTATQLAARPHGYGIVMTNSLIGGSTGSPRREVSVVDSLVTGYGAGGILFDGASGTDGSPASTTRAQINMYGYVTRSRVEGGGAGVGQIQNGIRYATGTRGSVVGSEVVDDAATQTSTATPPVTTRSSGLLLSDADVGTDPLDASRRAFSVSGTSFARNSEGASNTLVDGTTPRNADNADPAQTAQATDDYWGCATGPLTASPSATTSGCQGLQGGFDASGFRTAPPAALAVPTTTADAAPSAMFADPLAGAQVVPGDPVDPIVVARDDFGVSSVALTADGAPVGTDAHAPYEFEWSPSAAQAGRTVTLTATATDSSGQTTATSVPVVVGAAPAGTTTTPAGTTPTTPVDTTTTPAGSTTAPGVTTTTVVQVPVPVPVPTGPSGPSSTAPAAVKPAIRSTTLRAVRGKRTVAVRLRGSATAKGRFAGELRLTSGTTILARKTFTAAPGNVTVHLRLTTSAYRKLVARRTLRVNVTVIVRTSTGSTQRVVKRLTLKRPG